MNKAAAALVMSAGQRESLTVLARSSTSAHREVKRAKVLLMAADGVAISQIAAKGGGDPGHGPGVAGQVRRRGVSHGLALVGVDREKSTAVRRLGSGFRHLRIPAKGTVGCHARVTRDRTRILGPSSVAGSGAVTHIGRVPMYSDGVGGD
jgi:hypothetical protein